MRVIAESMPVIVPSRSAMVIREGKNAFYSYDASL